MLNKWNTMEEGGDQNFQSSCPIYIESNRICLWDGQNWLASLTVNKWLALLSYRHFYKSVVAKNTPHVPLPNPSSNLTVWTHCTNTIQWYIHMCWTGSNALLFKQKYVQMKTHFSRMIHPNVSKIFKYSEKNNIIIHHSKSKSLDSKASVSQIQFLDLDLDFEQYGGHLGGVDIILYWNTFNYDDLDI